MRIKAALGAGLLAIALSLGLVLARKPLVVSGVNLPVTHHTLIAAIHPAGACQAGEALPSGTSAIRLGLMSDVGSRVSVKVLSGTRVLSEGVGAPGWEGASVAVPLHPLPATFAPVTVCFQLTDLNGPIRMLGIPTGHTTAAQADGHALPGRMHIEYLRAGQQSWWSSATAVSWRLGLGRAAGGTWNSLALIALAAALVVLSSWLMIRELR